MYIFSFSAQAPALAISATSTASASVALPGKGNTVRFVNEGPNIAFASIGAGAQTATLPTGTAAATCTPIPVGDITLSLPAATVLNISVICRATQTAAITVQVGEGL
jgi:hypothetical protein